MNISFLLLLPILLPIVFGFMIGFVKLFLNPIIQRFFFLTALLLNAVIIIIISLSADMTIIVFTFSERLPILFKTDDLARFFCILSSIMFFIAGIYCPGYFNRKKDTHRFYMFFLFVLGMMMGFALSGNLLTLFFFLEILTFVSIPLVLHSMEKDAVDAAYKYLYYSVAGAAFALISFFFIYTYGTTLSFTQGGVMDMELLTGRENQILVFTLIAIIGFGAKAGMYPLHAWLPVAHPVAPAPASALLSGIITKIGVFAIIRFVYFLIGPDLIRGTWMQLTWISLALFTGIMGSLLAVREQILKTRLAYSTIGQIGYILFGLAILTEAGFTGALIQTIFHSISKNTLFLVSGIIILKTNKIRISELEGIGKKMPALLCCFGISALTLAGIPPTGGFMGKWHLISGALESNLEVFAVLGPIILLAGALLASLYLFPIVINGFLKESKPGFNEGTGAGPYLSMLIPVILLTLIATMLALFPQHLISFIRQIAGGLL
ncbi:MAG: hypothetical protein FWG77_00345 [Treponema sp.]|nr:hypothetical protein [Treponema sp.]